MRDAFADTRLWIFDLDNTLYPPPPALWRAVDAKMTAFIARHLSLDQVEAHRMQKAYYDAYGLTVRGLMLEHDVDPAAFVAEVHDVDLSMIEPDAALGAAIDALPGRKVIHTNSDLRHVERVLDRLGFAGIFDAVYDITVANYAPKPSAEPFDAVLSAEGIDPAHAAMFEDSDRNLKVPHDRGMRTVWVPTPRDEASHGADAAHIHFTTQDLRGFVAALATEREGAA